MKTITKRFIFDDGEVVTIMARFAQSAGCRSGLECQGNSKRVAALTGDISLPALVGPEGYENWWSQFNGKGVRIETAEEGEWREVTL